MIRQQWHEPWGDRRQELVFIGQNLLRADMTTRLEQALLTDDELALGPSGWRGLEDPFPRWIAREPETAA